MGMGLGRSVDTPSRFKLEKEEVHLGGCLLALLSLDLRSLVFAALDDLCWFFVLLLVRASGVGSLHVWC